MRKMLSIAAMITLVAPMGAAFGQIFSDQFDTYTAPSFLSTQGAPPLWVVDGCNDGKVDTGFENSIPNSIVDYKNDIGRIGIRNRHDLTAAEMMGASVVNGGTPTCVNGTDENPLVLSFSLYLGTKALGYYQWQNGYLELSCGSDRAPTPMTITTCASGKVRPHLVLDGDGQPHRSLAIGQIAWADPDPCDVPGSEVCATYRLTVYDGREWKTLQTPIDVHTCSNYNFVTMTVKTNTIDVSINTRYNGTDCNGPRNVRTTTITRQYTGPFTAIKMGGLPNELSGGCWGQDSNIDGNYSLGYPVKVTSFDDVFLQNGEAYDTPAPCEGTGACCLPDLSCIQATLSDCQTSEGTFNGEGTSCTDPQIKCCPTPFADSDQDGDVDMVDFAKLQRCLNIGNPGVVAEECKCFDTDDNGNIDGPEVDKFALCATGAGVTDIPVTCTP